MPCSLTFCTKMILIKYASGRQKHELTDMILQGYLLLWSKQQKTGTHPSKQYLVLTLWTNSPISSIHYVALFWSTITITFMHLIIWSQVKIITLSTESDVISLEEPVSGFPVPRRLSLSASLSLFLSCSFLLRSSLRSSRKRCLSALRCRRKSKRGVVVIFFSIKQ